VSGRQGWQEWVGKLAGGAAGSMARPDRPRVTQQWAIDRGQERLTVFFVAARLRELNVGHGGESGPGGKVAAAVAGVGGATGARGTRSALAEMEEKETRAAVRWDRKRRRKNEKHKIRFMYTRPWPVPSAELGGTIQISACLFRCRPGAG